MKTAIFYRLNPALLDGLRLSFREAGYNVTVVSPADDLMQVLGQQGPAFTLCELSKVSFAALLRAIVNVHPTSPVYMMEAGTVFCRYPLRSWHPDIASALRSAGVQLSERLSTRPADQALPINDDAILV
jgi:hypothetical protein